MNLTAQVENILSKFDVSLSNYEIVNIEEKKGWSSKFLFLIVEKRAQFVLKGKSKDQLGGYLSDIAISTYLKDKGFEVRTSVQTHDGSYHYVEDEIYWELKTYVAGSVEEFVNYTEESVKSLADLNISYIKSSLNSKDIYNIGLENKDFLANEDMIETILKYKDTLKSVIGNESEVFADWLHFARDEISQILTKNSDMSIIHNDLNNKNILLDLTTMHVTSFIDWDHGCVSTPLKDILEPVNMFYDFVLPSYDTLRSTYLNEIKHNYDLRISESELNLLQVYFYALNKWKYITFFAKLITDLGNTTNELSIFEEQVSLQLAKLKDLGKRCNVF
jgi:thiamine kinase-like enzyme